MPFAVKAFWQEPLGLALNLAAFGLLVLAAWLTRDGIRAAAAYAARPSARRPAIPRKLMATALTGAGLFLGALGPGAGITGTVILGAAILGAIGAALHLLAFGPDPLTDKGMEGIDRFQQDRVARLVDEGEAHLDAMRRAAVQAGDRQILARVDRFLATARSMFSTVEDDPRDLTAARKFLGVYLMGARDATIKFADLWARGKDPQARTEFEALLADLETNFAARTEMLMQDDKTDLEVEIDVLRDRLRREGIAPGGQ